MIRGVPSLLLLVLSMAICGGVGLAQEPPTMKGGTFVVEGKTVSVSADRMMQHLAVVRSLNPNSRTSRLKELAWARAIRIEAARAFDLLGSAKGFENWMRRAHEPHRAKLMRGGRVDGEKLRAHAKSLGFEDLAAYERFCFEEYQGTLWLDREFGPAEPTTEDIKKMFDLLTTDYVVSVHAWGAETLHSLPPLDRKKPADIALYEEWFAQLGPERRRIFDDEKRPAMAVEALFVDYGEYSMAEFRKYFETKRHETRGSFADRTAAFKPTQGDLDKMWARWSQFRRAHYGHLAAEIPEGLDDGESFSFVEEHFVRVWKMTKYLEKIREELVAKGMPYDFEAASKRHDLPYRRLPMQPIYSLVNIPNLRGTHYYAMRGVAPGELYPGKNLAEQPNTVYYVNGVAEQPGYHASLWRLLEFEDMKVRPATEVIDRAWPAFEQSQNWAQAQAIFNKFNGDFGAAVQADMKARKEAKEHPNLDAARQRVYESKTQDLKNADFLTPVYVRPFAGVSPAIAQRDPIGIRAQKAMDRDGVEFVTGGDRILKVGEIIGPAVSRDYRVGLVARVDRVVPPPAARFENDPLVRKRAEKLARQKRDRNRASQVRTVTKPAVMKQRYKLATEDFKKGG